MKRSKTEWIKIIRTWERSGLTRVEFCRRRKIKTRTFDYWRQKVRENAPARDSGLIKVQTVALSKPANSLHVELPNQLKITIPAGYDSSLLKRLLSDIREVL